MMGTTPECASTDDQRLRTVQPSRINIGSNKRIMTFFELDLTISAFVPLAAVAQNYNWFFARQLAD
jgi:hypothetical protein